MIYALLSPNVNLHLKYKYKYKHKYKYTISPWCQVWHDVRSPQHQCQSSSQMQTQTQIQIQKWIEAKEQTSTQVQQGCALCKHFIAAYCHNCPTRQYILIGSFKVFFQWTNNIFTFQCVMECLKLIFLSDILLFDGSWNLCPKLRKFRQVSFPHPTLNVNFSTDKRSDCYRNQKWLWLQSLTAIYMGSIIDMYFGNACTRERLFLLQSVHYGEDVNIENEVWNGDVGLKPPSWVVEQQILQDYGFNCYAHATFLSYRVSSFLDYHHQHCHEKQWEKCETGLWLVRIWNSSRTSASYQLIFEMHHSKYILDFRQIYIFNFRQIQFEF